MSTSIVTGDLASSVTLDAIAAANATAGSVAMNSNNFTGLSTATTAGQAVEFSQFESALDGLSYKPAVRTATNAALPAYNRVGDVITATSNGALTVDSIAMADDDRMILKDGAAGADNGIFVVTDAGDGSNPFVLTRADDANTAAEIDDGATAWVKEGSANGDTRWTQTETVTTINSDSIAFAQTGSATTVSSLDDLSDVDLTGLVDTSMLWNDNGTFKPTTALLFDNDTGQMTLSTTGASAGMVIGATQWYDSSGDMRTPDNTIVDGTSTLSGKVSTGAGLNQHIEAIDDTDSPFTVDLSTDHTLQCDTTSGTITVNLPAGHSAGDTIVIKDIAGNAGTNNITIDPNAAETVDGDATYPLDVDYMEVTLISDGTNWGVY